MGVYVREVLSLLMGESVRFWGGRRRGGLLVFGFGCWALEFRVGGVGGRDWVVVEVRSWPCGSRDGARSG